MISHQHPGMNPPSRPGAGLRYGFKEKAPVEVIVKDSLSSVATGHDMIERPYIFDPNSPCHRGHSTRLIGACQDLLTDPYSLPPGVITSFSMSMIGPIFTNGCSNKSVAFEFNNRGRL
jgi:hypothetical protein